MISESMLKKGLSSDDAKLQAQYALRAIKKHNTNIEFFKKQFENGLLEKNQAKCALDCRKCNLCKVARGLEILVPLH